MKYSHHQEQMRKQFFDELKRQQFRGKMDTGTTQTKVRKAPQLSSNALNLLLATNNHYRHKLTDLYKLSGLHAEQGRTALNELEARQLVKKRARAKSGRGGDVYLLEVLPAGFQELTRRGFQVKKPKGRGDFLHNVYAEEFAELKKPASREVWLDKRFGNKDYDAIGKYKDGRIWACEVYLTGSAGKIAEAVVRGAQPGIAELWIISDERVLLRNIQEEVNKLASTDVSTKCFYMFAGELYGKKSKQ